MKVALIFLGGSSEQNRCFWPSYNNCIAGYEHDIIYVHRDWLGVDKDVLNTITSSIIIENKIDAYGNDIPYRAFGAYRHYFNKYKDKYQLFIFISDDVIIRRDNWLRDIVEIMDSHSKIGFGASQIFHNKHNGFPNHLRAPFWFAKTYALDSVNWTFTSDHDGELKIADQLARAGFIGVQVGNKLNLAYDSLDLNSTHITCELERLFYPNTDFKNKFNPVDFYLFEKLLLNGADINNSMVKSTFTHIGIKNYFVDIEPFNNLIYKPSYTTAKLYIKTKAIYEGIYIYENSNY